jgi:hypothetical protein
MAQRRRGGRHDAAGLSGDHDEDEITNIGSEDEEEEILDDAIAKIVFEAVASPAREPRVGRTERVQPAPARHARGLGKLFCALSVHPRLGGNTQAVAINAA